MKIKREVTKRKIKFDDYKNWLKAAQLGKTDEGSLKEDWKQFIKTIINIKNTTKM